LISVESLLCCAAPKLKGRKRRRKLIDYKLNETTTAGVVEQTNAGATVISSLLQVMHSLDASHSVTLAHWCYNYNRTRTQLKRQCKSQTYKTSRDHFAVSQGDVPFLY